MHPVLALFLCMILPVTFFGFCIVYLYYLSDKDDK